MFPGFADDDCVDGPEGCSGDVIQHLALSGSGFRYPRCDRHYQEYVDRVAPQMRQYGRPVD